VNWRDVPESFYIREVLWRVTWVAPGELKSPRGQPLYGYANYDDRVIALCDSLKYDPMQLATVWLHEVLHAILPRPTPKWLDSKREHYFIDSVDAELARVLNQCGWSKS
jgi:hypothetical protein